MTCISSGREIFFVPDPQLLHFFCQLGIESRVDDGIRVVDEMSFAKAGLPFGFFKEFARLTSAGDTVQNNAVVRLLGKKYDRPRMGRFDICPTDKDDRDGSTLDAAEIKALKVALQWLDYFGDDPDEVLDRDIKKLEDPDAVIRRLRDIGPHTCCWFDRRNGGIGKTLFGRLTGASDPTVTYDWDEGRFINRGTEFNCPFLFTTAGITQGLWQAYREQRRYIVPTPIVKAGAATVKLHIKNTGAQGSGFLFYKPDIIVTAGHVAENDQPYGAIEVTVYFETGGFSTSFSNRKAHALRVYGPPEYGAPDIAVILVPGLTKKIEEAMEIVRGKVQQDISRGLIPPDNFEDLFPFAFAELKDGIPFRMDPIVRKETIFAIGIPRIDSFKARIDKVWYENPAHPMLKAREFVKFITHGAYDPNEALYQNGAASSDITVAHGDSGGPLVDEEGRVVGVITEFTFSSIAAYLGKPTKVTGTRFYPMNIWAPWIIRAIESFVRT